MFIQSWRLGFASQQYHGLGSEPAQGHCSGSLVMWGEMLCLIVGQGFWLGYPPEQGCRISSVAASALWSGFLMGITVGKGCKFASLPGWGSRTGSTVVKAC